MGQAGIGRLGVFKRSLLAQRFWCSTLERAPSPGSFGLRKSLNLLPAGTEATRGFGAYSLQAPSGSQIVLSFLALLTCTLPGVGEARLCMSDFFFAQSGSKYIKTMPGKDSS